MKAAVYHKYGDALRVTDVETPSPKDGEVLVKIHAASVNAYDWHLHEATPFYTRALSGVFRPKNAILGADMAGVVAAVGDGAHKFQVDDAVYGCLEGCGKSGLATGAFAEYVRVPERNLALMPPSLSFAEAAALPMAAVTALQALRDGAQLTKGQSVLIHGASGGVGLFALQIAKALGVCSAKSVATLASLGADHIIDYQKESAINGRQYDAIIDIAATIPIKGYRSALKRGGICIVVGYSTFEHLLRFSLAGKREGKTIKLCMADNKNSDDLSAISQFIEAGQLKVLIDSRYSLANATEALRRVKTGHPIGKVIIEVDRNT